MKNLFCLIGTAFVKILSVIGGLAVVLIIFYALSRSMGFSISDFFNNSSYNETVDKIEEVEKELEAREEEHQAEYNKTKEKVDAAEEELWPEIEQSMEDHKSGKAQAEYSSSIPDAPSISIDSEWMEDAAAQLREIADANAQ